MMTPSSWTPDLQQLRICINYKYEATTAQEVAQAQKHLIKEQRDHLQQALANAKAL